MPKKVQTEQLSYCIVKAMFIDRQECYEPTVNVVDDIRMVLYFTRIGSHMLPNLTAN